MGQWNKQPDRESSIDDRWISLGPDLAFLPGPGFPSLVFPCISLRTQMIIYYLGVLEQTFTRRPRQNIER
uniref:Uncharacterized protein n=1 Tax=Candidatus Kentrum sp. FW TaxID=2126338 RepID=A0A450SXW0_9GAMM|nr:MAG: hypothetical protein BECKFW1821B_GA0114236_104317 [Candidatus Kentron sp. FW]